MSKARIGCLMLLLGAASAWSQVVPPPPPPAKSRWIALFRSDDPAHWNKDVKNADGQQICVPVKFAPATFRYLRLRRMDTGESLILALTREQLLNGKPGDPANNYFWNGTAKEEWKGRHLGIAHTPRLKFPAPAGEIQVMNEGWDGFLGSGFGHKAFQNDGQYYTWKGREIKKTVFEISVSDGPLNDEEKKLLLTNAVPVPGAAPKKD